MKNKLVRRILLFLFILIIIISMEITMMNTIFDMSFNEYWYFEFATILLILCPIFMFKFDVTAIIYSSIWFGIYIALFAVNINLYLQSGYVFSLSDILSVGNLNAVMTDDMIDRTVIIKAILYVLLFALGLLAIFFTLKGKRLEKYHFRGLTIGMSIMLFSLIVRAISYGVVEYKYSSSYSNLSGSEIVAKTSKCFKNSSFKKYGMTNYLIGDIDNIMQGNGSNKVIYQEADINDYTGLLENYNVLEIMIETGVTWAVNETLTPNTYKLMNEGINFNNNYTKNKTNVSEYIGITGFGGGTNTLSHYAPNSLPNLLNELDYKTRYYHCNVGSFYDRSNLMPKLGFDETYFFRDILSEEERPNYCTSGSWNGNYPLDTEFIEDCLEETSFISKDEKFYTYWTTMSTHGPYNYGRDNIKIFKKMGLYNKIDYAIENNLYELPIKKYYDEENDKYSGIFSNNTEYEEIKEQVYCFQSEMMIFDLSLGMILDKLEEDNLIDNTLIIMYGDHDAYYKSNSEKANNQLGMYINGTSNVNDINLYETIMCMYNPTLNNKFKELNGNLDYNLFTSTNIIVPSILNLLGITYNKNAYCGNTIFDSDNNNFTNVFYSNEIGKAFVNDIIAIDLDDIIYYGNDKNYKNEFYNYLFKLMERIERIENTYN